MSLTFREGYRVYVYQDPIDMRAGFNKLSMFVREKMGCELLEGDLYLFLGKNRKRLKALFYDGTGLVQIAKRMEHGRFMSVQELEYSEITVEELQGLLHGGIVKRVKFGEEALTDGKEKKMIDSNETDRTRRQYRSSSPVCSSS